MRVAFVLSALLAGGAERVISLISEAAIAHGWQATIITFDRPDDPVFHALHPDVTLCRLALPGGVLGPRALVLAIRRVFVLRRALRSGDFAVVVSFLTKINTLTLLATIGSPVPVIVSERNNVGRQNASPWWHRILNLLYPRARTIVMLTEGSKAGIPARQRARAIVIPNPMPTSILAHNPANTRALVAVGRLTQQKGFDLLIDAFARITGDFPDWRLIIWGEGPDRAALEQQIARLDLARAVRLPGTSANRESWLETAGVFVLSSRYEGFSNATAEAMGAGLPVIAFDCDYGPSDMIDDGETGLLVRPEDTEALAAAMRRMMEDVSLRERLGRAARQRAADFSPASVTHRWLKLIESAAKTST